MHISYICTPLAEFTNFSVLYVSPVSSLNWHHFSFDYFQFTEKLLTQPNRKKMFPKTTSISKSNFKVSLYFLVNIDIYLF